MTEFQHEPYGELPPANLSRAHSPTRNLVFAFEQLPPREQERSRQSLTRVLEMMRNGSPVGELLAGPLLAAATRSQSHYARGSDETGWPAAGSVLPAHQLIGFAEWLGDHGVASHVPDLPSFELLAGVHHRLAARYPEHVNVTEVDYQKVLESQGNKRLGATLAAFLCGDPSPSSVYLFVHAAAPILKSDRVELAPVRAFAQCAIDALEFDRAPLGDHHKRAIVSAHRTLGLTESGFEFSFFAGAITRLAVALSELQAKPGGEAQIGRAFSGAESILSLGSRGLPLLTEYIEVLNRAPEAAAMETLSKLLHVTANQGNTEGVIASLLVFRSIGVHPQLIQLPRSCDEFLATNPSREELNEFIRNVGAIGAALSLGLATTEKDAADALMLLAALTGQKTEEALLFLREGGNAEERQAYRERQKSFYSPLRNSYANDAEVLKRGGIPAPSGEFVLFSDLNNYETYIAGLESVSKTMKRGSSGGAKAPAPANGPTSFLIPPVQENLNLWIRLASQYLGFGTDLFETRRLPDGEPSCFAQFALHHGSLHYLNSKDNTSFPGRGTVISRLDPFRLFAADPRRPDDPFHDYKSAWPTLGRYVVELDQFVDVFARGLKIVGSKDPTIGSLPVAGRDAEPMCLVILNSHFGNPTNEVAWLVPRRTIDAAIRRSLIPAEDFTSFRTDMKDLREVIPSFEALRALPGGALAVDIGDPRRILDSEDPTVRAWLDYNRDLATHGENIRAWDEWFRRRRHGGGLDDDEEKLTVTRQGKAEAIGYSTENHLQKDADALMARAAALVRNGRPKVSAEHLAAEELLAGLDLLAVARANWHRGYTNPKRSSEEQQRLEFTNEGDESGDEDITVNRDATRRLEHALSFHKARENGVTDKSQFPLLVIRDTLLPMKAPNLDWYLDTWDMTVHYKGKEIQLSTTAIEMEDALFWAQHVLPLAADGPGTMRDLRFRSREGLNLP